MKYFSEANPEISENVKKSHPELLSTTAVNDEVDRTIDDRTKSGDHITFDLPCEDMITVVLFKASNDVWDPIKKHDLTTILLSSLSILSPDQFKDASVESGRVEKCEDCNNTRD